MKYMFILVVALLLVAPTMVSAANTGNTDAMDGQFGAKVSGAPLTHALGGRGLMFGNTKPDFTPPVGWTGEAVIDDPVVFEKAVPGVKGVKKGDVVKIEKLGPGKYKLLHPKTGSTGEVVVKK